MDAPNDETLRRWLLEPLRLYFQRDDLKSLTDLLEGLTDVIARLCSADIDNSLARIPLKNTNGLLYEQKLERIAASVAENSNSYESLRNRVHLFVRALWKELWRLKKSQWIDPPELASQQQNLPSLCKWTRFEEPLLTKAYDRNADWPTRTTINYNRSGFTVHLSGAGSSSPSSQLGSEEAKLPSVGHSAIDVSNVIDIISSIATKPQSRLAAIRMLGRVSSSTVTKSLARFELLFSNMHCIMREASLFGATMDLLGRLLATRHEGMWVKVSASMCRMAPGIFRNEALPADCKIKFADFCRQMFMSAAHVMKYFGTNSMRDVFESYLDFLSTELGGLLMCKYTPSLQHLYNGHPAPGAFLSVLARIDPGAEWFRHWLHNSNYRMAVAENLVELLAELIKHLNQFCQYNGTLLPPGGAGEANVEIFRRELRFSLSMVLISLHHTDMVKALEARGLFQLFVNLHPITLAKQPTVDEGWSESLGSSDFFSAIELLLLELSKSNCGASCILTHFIPHSRSLHDYPVSNGAFAIELIYNSLRCVNQAMSIDFTFVYQAIKEVLLQGNGGELAMTLLGHLHCLYPPRLLAHFEEGLNFASMEPLPMRHNSVIALYSGFSPAIDSQKALRQWRTLNGSLINDCFYRKWENNSSPAGCISLPYPIEVRSVDQRRLAAETLSDFLTSGHAKALTARSKVDEKQPYTPLLSGLQFRYTGASYSSWTGDFGTMGLSTFVIITQPHLSASLLHYFRNELIVNSVEKRLANPPNSRVLRRLLRHLSVIMANLDALIELRKGGICEKLIEFLRDYSHHSLEARRCGRRMVADDESAREAVSCLSGALLAGPGERANHFDRPLQLLLDYAPCSLYSSAKLDGIETVFDGFNDMKKVVTWSGTTWEQHGSDTANEMDKNDSMDTYQQGDQEYCQYDEFFSSPEGMKRGGMADPADIDSRRDSFSHSTPRGGKRGGELLNDWNPYSVADEGPPTMVSPATIAPIVGDSLLAMEPRAFLFTFFYDQCRRESSVEAGELDDGTYPPICNSAIYLSLATLQGTLLGWRALRLYIERRLARLSALKQDANSKETCMNPALDQHISSAKIGWITPILDYAVALGKVSSRGVARLRCHELCLLPTASPPSECRTDWFLYSLFLSCGLDADATVEMGETILRYLSTDFSAMKPPFQLTSHAHATGTDSLPSSEAVLDKLDKVYAEFLRGLKLKRSAKHDSGAEIHLNGLCWPMAKLGLTKGYDYGDELSLRVFPKVLYLLHRPRLAALMDYLNNGQVSGVLPSLLHLLLFYSNQVYLGILDFPQVEEYLLGSVLGGAQFQASHFCAVLLFISRGREGVKMDADQNGRGRSTETIEDFLRPNLSGFRFHIYHHIFEELWLRSDEEHVQTESGISD